MGRMHMRIDGTGAYRCALLTAPSLDASFAFLELWTNYEARADMLFEHKSRRSCGLGDVRMRCCAIPPRRDLRRGCLLQPRLHRCGHFVVCLVGGLQRHVIVCDSFH